MSKRILIVKDEDITIFEYLKANLLGFSKNNIKSLLLKKMVSVNGNLVTKYDYLLKENDTVSIGTTEIGSGIKIVFADDNYLVLNKPAGLLTIKTEKEEASLYEMASTYVKQRNPKNKIFIVHRLDKDTSGIVLFAKNEKIKNALQNDWNDITKRIYYAVVFGETSDKGTLKSFLKETKTLKTYSSSKGKLAVTNFRKIMTNGKYTLVEIEIKTGRKNQIRVQFSDINHPIVGDTKYGDKKEKFKRMMLHAKTLEISDPISSQKLKFDTEIPNLFFDMVR